MADPDDGSVFGGGKVSGVRWPDGSLNRYRDAATDSTGVASAASSRR
jgi:hypothetical protein